jgi:SAM-dependent methyltransferase
MDLNSNADIDINQIKRASNEHQIEHWFENLFDNLGLNYISQQRLVKGRPDSLIGDIIIDFKFQISTSQLNKWVQSKGRQYIQEYFSVNSKYPSLLIVISESSIMYYDKNVILREQREINRKSIRSLIGCLLEPKTVNSEQFAILFGVNSPLYILSYARLEQHFDDHSGEKTVCFQQWKKHFRLAYHDEEVGKELFLRHSYLSMLLKLILYKEFIQPEDYKRESFRDLEDYFEIHGISLFHYDFFRWVINVVGLCDDIFAKLKIMKFEATDIFRTIYQEMIIAGVRHKLGEYYTPEILCKKMVNKVYTIGDRVLDPSCGSGTFLIETYKKIDEELGSNLDEKPSEEWLKAVNNVFGFDINPIAILTTKANLILYLKSRKEWMEKISINIYLCNSIDPIEFSPTADIELGSFYSFCVDLIDNEIELRIPEEALIKENIEHFQMIIKSIYGVWEEFEDFNDTWEAVVSSQSSEVKKSFLPLKLTRTETVMNEILKRFFGILYSLRVQDKDHIWLYLLNNIVGIRLLLLTKKMDLIITNPPWLTYKDADPKLKANMKKISAQFNIKPEAKNITNIEEAIIFLYKIPDLYLRKDGKGKIAFVMPRSLLVSSQNEKARRFDEFKDIEFFEFDDLVFNIDCCCVFGKFMGNGAELDDVFGKYPIPTLKLDSKTMEELETYDLSPYVYFQTRKNEKYSVKKLIKPENKEQLLPIYLSEYYIKFIQGADLIPKSLLYCKVENTIQNGKISIISPWVSPQAKGNWKKRYYKNQRVESENLFKATLSRGLYPFCIIPYDAFLPLDSNFNYNLNNIGPFSRKHWNTIKDIYQKINKEDLFKVGINYRNKLCSGNSVRASQRRLYKVVFPNAKKLMSAVIVDPDGRVFVDSTLYYLGIENEKEAYYICGMLNIPELYKTVKFISDTRHHHKRPLYFNIPKYRNREEQNKIAHISKKCSKIVGNYLLHTSKIKESEIYELIQEKLREISTIGIQIFTSITGLEIVKEYEYD